MRLFSEIGGATLEGAGSGRSCQNISKCILYLGKLLSCGGFCVCSNFFCTFLHIACKRVYVIYDTHLQQTAPSKFASSTEQ